MSFHRSESLEETGAGYVVHPLLKLPLVIDMISSCGESRLLVNTRQGHLLMYSVDMTYCIEGQRSANCTSVFEFVKFNSEKMLPSQKPQLQLLRTSKTFCRPNKAQPYQMVVVQSLSLLISMIDGIVTVHDLDMTATNFSQIFQLTRAKGATFVALQNGERSNSQVRLGVVVRRKIQFYFWQNRKFEILFEDINFSDIPRCFSWLNESICVGTKTEYFLVVYSVNKKNGDFSTPKVMQLFPTGRNQEPSVTSIHSSRFGLSKDDQTTFIDLEGRMKLYMISWSETPVCPVIYDAPYLIAITSKTLEVMTEEPKSLVQKMSMKELATNNERVHLKHFNVASHGFVYCASDSQIWILQMIPASLRIPTLLESKQFELAAILSEMEDDDVERKLKRSQHIQTLYAFDLFCNRKFKDSMNLFFEYNIDPSHVVGLYPKLLPQEFRFQLKYPGHIPDFYGRDVEESFLCLIEYLTKVRHKLTSPKVINSTSDLEYNPIVEDVNTLKSRKQLMQIVDTTLLKVYLRTNDALVAPLLRLNDNSCHVQETERVLKRGRKHSELVIFYKNRKFHWKALDLIRQDCVDEDFTENISKMINYLQYLSCDDVDLILQFAKWIMEYQISTQCLSVSDFYSQFLSIFIGMDEGQECCSSAEHLPRDRVLSFLMNNKLNKDDNTILNGYLEHVINTWKDQTPVFTNTLILSYKGALDMNTMNSEVNRISEKLVSLLKSSECYDPIKILSTFNSTDLSISPQFSMAYSILIGKLGQHEKAIDTLLLKSSSNDEKVAVENAVQYCQYFSSPGLPHEELFTLLLRKMFDTVKLELCIHFMNEHSSRIDLKVAIGLIPDDVPVHTLMKFLMPKLSDDARRRSENQLIESLSYANFLNIEKERIRLQSDYVYVSESDVCCVCNRRFHQLSANGGIVKIQHEQKSDKVVIVHGHCRARYLRQNVDS